MRTLGPKYGKLLGGIRAHLAQADGMLVVSTVRGGAAYEFEVDGSKVSLQEEDVLVEPAQREGLCRRNKRRFRSDYRYDADARADRGGQRT